MTSRDTDVRGKADMHLHTLYSDGTSGVEALLDHIERRTDLDLVAITDHERLDGALRAREIHAAGTFRFELVVGEEITTRRGHVLALQHDPDPRHHLDAIELLNPSAAGRSRRLERLHLNEEHLHLPAVGNSDAHILEHVGSGWTWFPGASAADYRRAVLEHATEPDGEHWSHWHNVAVYGRQLVAKARHLRHTLRPTGEWR